MYRMGDAEIEEIAKVIHSKRLFRTGDAADGHLAECERFEREWADTIGGKYSLLLSGGGTAALICSLVGLGIGPGDEVIIPGYTFMATAVAVMAVGAIPVIAEVDETLAIDPDDVESKIGPNTRVLIPVHMAGMPCDMERLCAVAARHNLKIVEDCCQSDGGSYKGRRLGAWGDVGAYSFNYFKIIGCGDGGGLVTDDATAYERALIYHDSGITFRPIAEELTMPIFAGVQYRASEIMGAMMRIQLQRLDSILTDLRRVRRAYHDGLSGCSGVRPIPSNDYDGDCGVVAGFQFDSAEEAQAFASYPGVGGLRPIDSGRHVYCNWEPVMEKRAGAHPAMNPFYFPQNRGLRADYTKDMCPKTLDILSRSVIIYLNPDWTDSQIAERVDACRRACEAL